ncbi:hypothetical protein MMA231_02126 [Asticcacaulis sp. MM231]|uniref:acyltransferase family protein n=1 Tax=Asticcacaulis sp. MM231 TaxID=3157666 RepID=UPI0032D5820F
MWQIFWPAMALILLVFALKRQFVWSEFFFVSHWFTADSFFPPFMPYWYIQVMLQICLGLMILFVVPVVRDLIVRHLYTASLLFLLVSGMVVVIFPDIWDTSALYDWLPHLQLWNFVIGWFIHASLERAQGQHGWIYRLTATVMVLLCGFSLLWGSWSQCLIFVLGGVLLCWASSVPIPRIFSRPVMLCSQAIFTIYLLHAIMPALSQKTLYAWFHIDQPLLDGVLAMISCIGLWAAWTAAKRAFRGLALQAGDFTNLNKDANVKPRFTA